MAAAVAWLFIAAYTVLGAIALYPSAGMKATMGPVLMWAVAFLYAFSGLVCLFSPNAIRTAAGTLTTFKAARIAGIAYVILGAALFRVATATHVPLLAQIFGVIAFMEGGVQLLRPIVCITLTEWWIDQRNGWYRAAGVVCLALAALFAWGAGPVKPTEPAAVEIVAPEEAAPAELPAVLPPADQTSPPAP